jgi:hypothetical protein
MAAGRYHLRAHVPGFGTAQVRIAALDALEHVPLAVACGASAVVLLAIGAVLRSIGGHHTHRAVGRPRCHRPSSERDEAIAV